MTTIYKTKKVTIKKIFSVYILALTIFAVLSVLTLSQVMWAMTVFVGGQTFGAATILWALKQVEE